MSWFKTIKPVIPILLLVIFFVVISFYIPKELIEKFVVSAGVLAPLAFIFASLLTLIFAPLSGTPVISIGFYLFGNIVVIYSYLALLIAMVVNFWIARIWGIALVTRLVGKDNLDKLNQFTKEHGLKTLFLTRFFMTGFEDILSYAAGLTSMNFKHYLITSIVATVPWTIFWYFFSDKLNAFQFTVTIVALSGVFLLSFGLWEKYFHKRQP